MTDLTKQIENIQKEIRETPYHKGTEHHIGMLRAKVARLKDRINEDNIGSGSKGSSRGYGVKKQGDATIILVGPPSVGKSTLINLLTNANSKIAPYLFTTITVIPGMMEYKNARIQILDVPGLIEGAEEGKGEGKKVLSVIRGSDLLLIITEPKKINAFSTIASALERNGIRVNKSQPNVLIDKKLGGGINIHSNIKQDLSKDTIGDIAREFGINNAEIIIKEKLTIDTCIDAFSNNRVYIPAIFVVNKSDLPNSYSDDYVNFDSNNIILISAKHNRGVNKLLEDIWEKLNFICIYLFRKNEKPSYDNPLVVKKGTTLYEVSKIIGERFSEKYNSAHIWGSNSKFPDQEVSLSTKAINGMQVRFV